MPVVAVGVPQFANSLLVPFAPLLSEWVARVVDANPTAVVLGDLAVPWSGREIAVSMARRAPMLPVIGVVARGDVAGAIRWFQTGAWDVVEAPLSDIEVPPRPIDSVSRFLAWVKERRLSGEMLVYPDTPFEGRVRFEEGSLADASLFSLTREAILETLLDPSDTTLKWQSTHHETRARVLVVEDDEQHRRLIGLRLENQGYLVTLVSDGVEALSAVSQASFDVVVLDLHMPRLDGWRVLRTLQADLRTRELPVVLLSAHEGDVDALKAARAGARAYLKKSGHAKDLLASIDLLTRARREVLSRVAQLARVEIDSSAIGMHWFISLLSERAASGVFEFEDALGRYELRVNGGHLLEVATQQGSLRVTGGHAFDALLTARGSGRFVPQPTIVSAGAPLLADQLAESVLRRTASTSSVLRELSTHPERLSVHEELGAIFGKSASVDELNVLSGLRERLDLAGLSETTRLSIDDVEDIVQHLLWRGVVVPDDAE